jgi:hypothetical protein
LSQLYVWVLKTRLTPTRLFIEVPASCQVSERSCICVLGISIMPLSMIFLQFGTFPTCLKSFYLLLFVFYVLHFKKFTVFFNLTYNYVHIFFLWIILTWFPWKSVAAKKISYWIRGWLWLIWNHHFYCLRHDLVNGIYVSQMTTDMIRLW